MHSEHFLIFSRATTENRAELVFFCLVYAYMQNDAVETYY